MKRKIILFLFLCSTAFAFQQEAYAQEATDGYKYTAPVRLIHGTGQAGITISIDSLRATRTKPGEGGGSVTFDAWAEFQLPLSMFEGSDETTTIRFKGENLPIAGSDVTTSRLQLDLKTAQGEFRIPLYQNKVSMVIDTDSYVDISCNGFEGMRLKGYFEFNDSFIYAAGEGGGKVKAEFDMVFKDVEDMLFLINFDSPFKLKGAGDFQFSVKDAVVDMSTIRNADGFQLPNGYSSGFPVEDASFWTGFSLKAIEVRFPEELSFGSEDKTTLNVYNMLIDEYGLTGWFSTGLSGVGTEGNKFVNFSLDSISVGIVKSKLNDGTLTGSLEIKPLKDEKTPEEGLKLALSGRFYSEGDQLQYDFGATLKENETYALPFVQDYGTITLGRGCNIQFKKGTDGMAVNVNLNGNLSFQSNTIAIADLRFQDLTISTEDPNFGGGVFALSSSAGFELGGLKMSLTKFEAGYNAEADIAEFGAGMKLEIISDGSGASVSGGFSLRSDVKNDWEIIGLQVDTIRVKVDYSAFGLDGKIGLFTDDPTYGNGFSGSIKLKITPIKLTVDAACQFGKTLRDYKKGETTQGAFRYWYAKLGVDFSGMPIMIFPPSFYLKSVAGGVYSKMERSIQSENFSKEDIYVPDSGVSFGFIVGAGAYFATDGLISADVEIEMSFASSGGLRTIRLGGAAYMLAEEQENSIIRGEVEAEYNFADEIFHAEVGVDVDAKVITGKADIVLHTDPKEWWFYLGTCDRPINLNFAGIAEANAYFMMGKVPARIAPLDRNIVTKFGISDYDADPGAAAAGTGFAFGMAMKIDAGFSSFIYANIALGGGTDAVVRYNDSLTCGGSHFRASTNAYVYMEAGAGVKVRDKKFEVIYIGAFAGLHAEIPKPYMVSGRLEFRYRVLGGMISGNARAGFSAGSTCTWTDDRNFEYKEIEENIIVDEDDLKEMEETINQTEL
jgi:hypothetical protein